METIVEHDVWSERSHRIFKKEIQESLEITFKTNSKFEDSEIRFGELSLKSRPSTTSPKASEMSRILILEREAVEVTPAQFYKPFNLSEAASTGRFNDNIVFLADTALLGTIGESSIEEKPEDRSEQRRLEEEEIAAMLKKERESLDPRTAEWISQIPIRRISEIDRYSDVQELKIERSHNVPLPHPLSSSTSGKTGSPKTPSIPIPLPDTRRSRTPSIVGRSCARVLNVSLPAKIEEVPLVETNSDEHVDIGDIASVINPMVTSRKTM